MDQDVQIVQCPFCQARYRVPASKLVSGKTQVRCVKCQQAFLYSKPDEHPEPSSMAIVTDISQAPPGNGLGGMDGRERATGSATNGTRRCPFCAEEILAAAVKCKHCGSTVTQPGTTQPPPGATTSRATRFAGKGKVRSFWMVLLLMIVTLGVYYFYWLHANTRDVRDACFSETEKSVADTTMSLFWATLVTNIAVFVITLVTVIVDRSAANKLPIHITILTLISIAVAAMFFFNFTKTMAEGQIRAGLEPFNATNMFLLIVVTLVFSLISNFVPFMGIVGAIFSFIYIYKIQKQINRIWAEE